MGSKSLEKRPPAPARMVPGWFSKAGGGHESILNPFPAQMRGPVCRKEVGAASKGEALLELQMQLGVYRLMGYGGNLKEISKA